MEFRNFQIIQKTFTTYSSSIPVQNLSCCNGFEECLRLLIFELPDQIRDFLINQRIPHGFSLAAQQACCTGLENLANQKSSFNKSLQKPHLT